MHSMVASNKTIEAVMRAISDDRTEEAEAVAGSLDSSLVPALFERIEAGLEGPADHEDPRRLIESIHAVARAAAQRHPDTFISSLRSGSISRSSLALLLLAELRRPDGADILVDALESPSWLHRKNGINGLDRLGAGDALTPHLSRLLRDTDSSVAFSAVQALIRWGASANIPELQTFRASASVGSSELALDAIEAICSRANLALPSDHPGPRLETVRLTVSGLPSVTRTLALVTAPQHVRAGRPLVRLTTADGAEWEIDAPCDGVVVRIDIDIAQAVIQRSPPRSEEVRGP